MTAELREDVKRGHGHNYLERKGTRVIFGKHRTFNVNGRCFLGIYINIQKKLQIDKGSGKER